MTTSAQTNSAMLALLKTFSEKHVDHICQHDTHVYLYIIATYVASVITGAFPKTDYLNLGNWNPVTTFDVIGKSYVRYFLTSGVYVWVEDKCLCIIYRNAKDGEDLDIENLVKELDSRFNGPTTKMYFMSRRRKDGRFELIIMYYRILNDAMKQDIKRILAADGGSNLDPAAAKRRRTAE